MSIAAIAAERCFKGALSAPLELNSLGELDAIENYPAHITLELSGKPMGFQSMARKGQWNRSTRAVFEWCKELRAMLWDVYGVRGLPVDSGTCWHIVTAAHFPDRRHCDPENVHKLAKDALFYESGGLKDKVTSGAYGPPHIDKGHPRALIQGWWYTWNY